MLFFGGEEGGGGNLNELYESELNFWVINWDSYWIGT